MAGIRLSETEDWIVARWVYEYFIGKISCLVIPTSLTLQRLHQSQTDGTMFTTFADVSTAERQMFYDAVLQVHRDVNSRGSAVFKSPEAFPGFMKRIEDLIELMKEEWPDVCGDDGPAQQES